MPKSRIPKRIKLLVAARANYRCEYCQCLKAYVPDPFRADHVTPESKGGSSTLENLANTCDGCNGGKQKRTEGVDPATGQIANFYHPRREKWKDHFKWSPDFLLIEGITPSGRATVKALKMNREELVNLRDVLKLIGKHPPKDTI